MRKSLRKSLPLLIIVLFGVSLGLALSEVFLQKVSIPDGGVSFISENLVHDAELGFRPDFDEVHYNRFGVRTQGFALASDGERRRLLIMGDSVVARGQITEKICDTLERSFECWNGAVSGYNTSQQYIYFKKYLRSLPADEVILFFHLNDFSVTPVIAPDDSGGLVAFLPGAEAVRINKFLFENSYVYGRIVRARFSELSLDAAETLVQSALEGMQSMISSQRFRVVIMPYFQRLDEWSSDQIQERERILMILSKLRIRHLDLLPLLKEYKHDSDSLQKSPGDFWHPSEIFESAMVEYLADQKFLHFPMR